MYTKETSLNKGNKNNKKRNLELAASNATSWEKVYHSWVHQFCPGSHICHHTSCSCWYIVPCYTETPTANSLTQIHNHLTMLNQPMLLISAAGTYTLDHSNPQLTISYSKLTSREQYR